MVGWRVAGGGWQNATATDGKFDSYNESFTFTAGPLTDGTYLFEVRATNSVGNVSSIAKDSLNVKLNTSPIANAGPDQIATTGSGVIFDGSKSYDPEGDSLTYQWYFVSTPPGSSAKISIPTATMPIFTPDKDGAYIVQLVVNDGKLASEADTVKITSLGLTQHILISTNQSSYASGDTLELFICLGNSKTNPDIKADIFLGFVKSDDSLLFFDPSLSKLVAADPNDLTTFTPSRVNVTIPSGFVSPTTLEANADMDKDGTKEVFRFFSARLPALKTGTYYAFGALARPGSYITGEKEIIGDVSIVKFNFSP